MTCYKARLGICHEWQSCKIFWGSGKIFKNQMQIMIGRPGQTRPLVKEMEKEKEKEETIWRKKIIGKRRTR